jgi:peptidoglycan/LPS O-acetylase OafA/YrhL
MWRLHAVTGVLRSVASFLVIGSAQSKRKRIVITISPGERTAKRRIVMERRSATAEATLSAATAVTHTGTRLPYLRGLDGVRALAVIAVLLYHGGLGVLGGFLGVETFFVLSGFLITGLLLAEWRQNGSIKLTRFWLRRARRLLPALLLLLLGTALLVALLLPQETGQLRTDILAALSYVMNWHLIVGQQSYFDPALRPPLLQHLWSLAIEEQFYLLWPFIFGIGMRYLRRTGFLLALLGTSAASLALMAAIADPGADPSRVYYGTDTRASALLIGSALALLWSPWHSAPSAGRGVGLAVDMLGLAALSGLLLSYLRLFEYHPLLYRGGFALVSLATAAVIVAVTHPGARLMPTLLGWKPLTWIGLRSYGIYLWHWPIFMMTRPYIDVSLDGWQLFGLRCAAVLLLAELSFRFVELPIRRDGLAPVRQWLRSLLAIPIPRGAFANRGDTIPSGAVELRPANSGAGLPAQPLPAPLLIEANSHAGRRSRAQRHGRSNGRRRHHHRRSAI